MSTSTYKADFLDGGGITGELIRNKDWAATALGPMEQWPMTLKKAVRSMLHSPLPTCVAWGPELVQLYNDAFIPTMGTTRHPWAMGRTLKEITQTWSFIEPLLARALRGESVSAKDVKLPLDKNGFTEDCYLDIYYVPIYNDDWSIGGLECVAIETTDKVKALQQSQEDEQRFRQLIELSPVPIALFTGREMNIAVANDMMIAIWGKGHSVIGMPLADALPELQGQPFLQLLEDVYTTGIAYEAKAAPAVLEVNGVLGTYYFDFAYTAMRNADGEVYGVMDTAVEVTSEVLAKRALEESKRKLDFAIDAAELGTFELNPATGRFAGNDRLKEWFGLPPDAEIPLNVATDVIADADRERVLAAIARTLEFSSGGGYDIDYTIIHPKTKKETIVKAKGKTLFDSDGKPYSFAGILQDVTAEVTTLRKLEKSQEELLVYFEQSPIAIATISRENLTFRLVNPFYAELVGRKPHELENKPLMEALPELKGQGFDKLLNDVITTGKPFIADEVSVDLLRNGVMETRYVNLTYQPNRNANGEITGVLVVATDVTQQVLSRKKVEENEAKLRAVIEAAPAAIGVFIGEDLVVENPNTLFIQVIGKGNDIAGKPLKDVLSGAVEQEQVFVQLISDVYNTGRRFQSNETEVVFTNRGQVERVFFNINFIPLFDQDNKVYAVLDVSVDVTAQVLDKRKIEAKEKELRDLITASPIGICVVKGNPAWVEEVNDRFLQIAGKERKQFEEAPYWEVLSEVAPAFESVLTGVFNTGIKYTTEEQEAVLIRRGKPEKVFLTFEYLPVTGSAGNVTKVIIMAVEVTHQVAMREQIQEAVNERTQELAASNSSLQRSNAELEQFAYIASHDLQEPIRKISTFVDMLEHSIDNLSDRSKNYIDKIYSSTDRMTKLIRDVLIFSQVSQNKDAFKEVDLEALMKEIQYDFELMIEKKRATINTGSLPVVRAIPSQMTQLFSNLLSNSLKYIKQGTDPVIAIGCTAATKDEVARYAQLDHTRQYHHITFSDNGIGFDQAHADRIFNIFQRLHGKNEYEGTGIGLSICRKIVERHAGVIWAMAGVNGGAAFHILLPY